MNKLFISAFLLFSTLIARSQDYVITKLGVGADSTKLNTTVIQSVIDKANASGGGTIVIPKGVYLTGALFLNPKPAYA